jgi:hypothetical protein
LFFLLTGLLVIVLPRSQAVEREVLVGLTITLFQLIGTGERLFPCCADPLCPCGG